MERIGFVLERTSGALLAGLLRERRLRRARIQRSGRGLETVRPDPGKQHHASFGRAMAQAQQDTTRTDSKKRRSKYPARQDSALYRDLSWNHSYLSRVARDGATEPAAVAAPSLCRVVAGRYSSGEVGKPGHRLHEGTRCDDHRCGRECMEIRAGRARNSGIHLIRLRPDAFEAGSN